MFPRERLRPENMRTGGSRESPNVIHLHGGSVYPAQSERRTPLQNCQALGSLREPPVTNTFGLDDALQRISRGLLAHAKAAPLQIFCALSRLFPLHSTRRIELEVPVPSDKDAFEVCDKMQQLVSADKRVLQNPSPEVQVTGASHADAKVMLGAWVSSADYGSVNRSIQEKVLKEVVVG